MLDCNVSSICLALFKTTGVGNFSNFSQTENVLKGHVGARKLHEIVCLMPHLSPGFILLRIAVLQVKSQQPSITFEGAGPEILVLSQPASGLTSL